MKVLGIETSCDETAIAVVNQGEILSNVIASQGKIHAPYGGVVPEIASRHHIENLPIILRSSLEEAQIKLEELEGIATTCKPGLLGALLAGLQYGKSLAYALQKPFIGVDHLEAHLHSVFLEHPGLRYPFLGLVVSGGHTHLYQVQQFGNYRLLGATRDDACGEAYDKVAKLLQLGYPGGPHLDKLAQEGNPKAFRFTIPKLGEDSLDFSFSGIKTACLLEVQKQKDHCSDDFKRDLAASFQEMATHFLMTRLDQAAKRLQLRTLCIVGGVAANKTLRQKLAILAEEKNYEYKIPSVPLCTDNGAMIAYVGWRYFLEGKRSPWSLNGLATCDLA